MISRGFRKNKSRVIPLVAAKEFASKAKPERGIRADEK
jgi:hypothetical protein